MTPRQLRSSLWLRPALLLLAAGTLAAVIMPAAAASSPTAMTRRMPARVGGANISARAAAKQLVVTLFSDAGDFIGGGIPQEFDHTNASFSGVISTGGTNLTVSGGTSGLSYSLVIDPPLGGQPFGDGYYNKVQRAEFRATGYAGLDISGNGSGCNTDSGAIEVRDLGISGSLITRFDLLFEQHCEGLVPALFGEIRYGEPHTSGLIVSSGDITWPSAPAPGLGAAGTPVPVYVRNSGTATVNVGQAALSGYAASEFGFADDSCSRSALPPGGACSVFVKFHAGRRGPQPASLDLPLGRTHFQIQLDGLVGPGTTSLTMKSQPGDYVGGGGSYHFTSANARFLFHASVSGLEADLTASGGEFWTVDMYPGSGNILAVGNYPSATRYPFNGTGNGLSVYGDGRGCNTLTGSFRVKQVAFSAVDNSLQHFDGTFIQHCEGAAPALTGELKYDAEAVRVIAPVSRLHAVNTTSGVKVTWTNPSTAAYRYTVVRVEQSRAPYGVSPIAGAGAFAGAGTSVVIPGLSANTSYTIVVYAVDQYGNVSVPAEATIRV